MVAVMVMVEARAAVVREVGVKEWWRGWRRWRVVKVASGQGVWRSRCPAVKVASGQGACAWPPRRTRVFCRRVFCTWPATGEKACVAAAARM